MDTEKETINNALTELKIRTGLTLKRGGAVRGGVTDNLLNLEKGGFKQPLAI